MTEEEILNEFRAAAALLEGHFILSSGLRSSRYLQCARVMSDPGRGGRLCVALGAKIRGTEGIGKIDLVVSPAMGGVIVGYEVARALKVPAIFCERVEGEFQFRRGFEIPPGARCLMVEDVVTTGLSSKECMAAIEAHGGNTVGAAALVDRSNGSAEFDLPFVALLSLNVPTYEANDLPEDLASIPAIKPGSRGLNA